MTSNVVCFLGPVRGIFERTGWSQARLAAALREVAKDTGLPTPGVDAVTVNRWVAGKQCPTSFYVTLLVALLTLLLSAAAHDPGFEHGQTCQRSMSSSASSTTSDAMRDLC
jgi:hypothetical protein